MNMDRHLRFTRFRLGISEIKVHAFRYKHVCHAELLCPLCKQSEEDEVHFVLICPVLNDLRRKFIAKTYYAYPCMFRLCLLMSSNDARVVHDLALYLFKALQSREIIIP